MTSYATERKIRIIRERLGDDWKTKCEGQSIDAIYNEIIGDTRKNLFCKVDSTVKEHLDEMVAGYKVTMAELVEHMIEHYHRDYLTKKNESVKKLAEHLGG